MIKLLPLLLLIACATYPTGEMSRMITANFLPADEVVRICNTRACYFAGEIWLIESAELQGQYMFPLTVNFRNWGELSSDCDQPACVVNGVIQAHLSFNAAMCRELGGLVYAQQGWSATDYQRHEDLGHEIIHAFGGRHPEQNNG